MKYLKIKDNQYHFVDEDEAEFAIVPIHEYHGLKLAKEINTRKFMQQANKALVDENGYMLVSAHQRKYKNKHLAWHITKQSPIPSKVKEIQEQTYWDSVSEAIKMDLTAYYNYIEFEEIEYLDKTYSGQYRWRKKEMSLSEIRTVHDMTIKDDIWTYDEARERFNGDTYKYYDGDRPQVSERLALWTKLDSMNWKYSWGLDDVSLNFKEGCVVVSYWANEIF